jgi:hypothetical protein
MSCGRAAICRVDGGHVRLTIQESLPIDLYDVQQGKPQVFRLGPSVARPFAPLSAAARGGS